jgi:hypothetical protein
MLEQDHKPVGSPSPIDILVEIAGAVGVALLVVPMLLGFNQLPDRVPIHFGVVGQPDRWGSRLVLLALAVVTLLIYAGLSALNRIPQHFNYPWPITATNAPRQFQLARRMLRVLKVAILWLFLSILFGASQVALGEWSSLPPWLLPGGLAAIAVTISWYFVAARRAR